MILDHRCLMYTWAMKKIPGCLVFFRGWNPTQSKDYSEPLLRILINQPPTCSVCCEVYLCQPVGFPEGCHLQRLCRGDFERHGNSPQIYGLKIHRNPWKSIRIHRNPFKTGWRICVDFQIVSGGNHQETWTMNVDFDVWIGMIWEYHRTPSPWRTS